MSLGSCGSQNPYRTHGPAGQGGGRVGLGPSSAILKGLVCANQQGGVRSRCPHLTSPSQTGSRSRGEAVAVLLYPSCMARAGDGAGGRRPDEGCEPSHLPPPTLVAPLAGL